MDMTQEYDRAMSWLSIHDHNVICPYCYSMLVYKYELASHGYGCADCGKDFGNVLEFPRKPISDESKPKRGALYSLKGFKKLQELRQTGISIGWGDDEPPITAA